MSDFTPTQVKVLDLLQNNDHNMWISFFDFVPESSLTEFVTDQEERYQEYLEDERLERMEQGM